MLKSQHPMFRIGGGEFCLGFESGQRVTNLSEKRADQGYWGQIWRWVGHQFLTHGFQGWVLPAKQNWGPGRNLSLEEFKLRTHKSFVKLFCSVEGQEVMLILPTCLISSLGASLYEAEKPLEMSSQGYLAFRARLFDVLLSGVPHVLEISRPGCSK